MVPVRLCRFVRLGVLLVLAGLLLRVLLALLLDWALPFLAGFAWWGYRHIRQRLLMRHDGDADRREYWILAGWFWVGYMGWLVNGIFGHDFYRIWWLAQAMCLLGIFIGAIVNGSGAVGEAPPEAAGEAPPEKADGAS